MSVHLVLCLPCLLFPSSPISRTLAPILLDVLGAKNPPHLHCIFVTLSIVLRRLDKVEVPRSRSCPSMFLFIFLWHTWSAVLVLLVTAQFWRSWSSTGNTHESRTSNLSFRSMDFSSMVIHRLQNSLQAIGILLLNIQLFSKIFSSRSY